MATTLAASAYFLTCCRPIHNSFGYCIEKPKLIDYYHYPFEYFLKHPSSECKYNHGGYLDHSINIHNKCTDVRAWALDERQKRQHFQDIISHQIPHCSGIKRGKGDGDGGKPPVCCVPVKEKEKSIKEEEFKKKADDELRNEKLGLRPDEEDSSEEKPPAKEKSKEDLPEDAELIKIKSEIKLEPSPSGESGNIGLQPCSSKESQRLQLEPSLKSIKSEKSLGSKAELHPKDLVDLTDELIEKLDRNLRNLETTFDKFVKKNRDFIQNLVECLDFEKQKQKGLEDDYNNLKQENEALKTQNDYLKMVNNKQLDLFKGELDKGISENKVIYKRKIHLMERQLQNDQNELQMYKQTEKKYMEVVEQDNEKIEKLNSKIDDLKNKEMQLVKNYLQLLKFLENVKNILSSADPKEIPQLRSINTLADSESDNDPNVSRVLKSALSNGITTLNVRDLSILHDAIEGLNDGLCHHSDKCGKSPTTGSSYPDFSSMSIHRIVIEHSHQDIPKGYETSSNLSIDRFPTRQKREERRVGFND